MGNFTVKDSGKREEFGTGAVRDTAMDKPRPDLISPFALERIGEHLRKGAQKYSAWNWAKGIPSSRCYESCMRHLMQFAQGDASEDHLSAAVFNLMAIIHNQEVARRGVQLKLPTVPGNLNDFPVFIKDVEEQQRITESDNPDWIRWCEIEDEIEASNGLAMKRKAIKFSGDYPKLHGQTSAELIAVRDIQIDRDTPAELLVYDTTKSDGSRYELKTGKYLQLIFVGNLGIPFCTIRSAGSDGKRDYYVLSIGEIFNIEVKGDGNVR